MSSRFTKTGLLILGILLASSSPRDVMATERDPIPFTTAEWIASAAYKASPIGMPGVHVHGGTKPPATPNGPLPIFRKSFVLDETAISCAQVAICGLGHFELSVNGEKVGDHVLDPPWSDYSDAIVGCQSPRSGARPRIHLRFRRRCAALGRIPALDAAAESPPRNNGSRKGVSRSTDRQLRHAPLRHAAKPIYHQRPPRLSPGQTRLLLLSRSLPTSARFHSNWQWWHLVKNSRPNQRIKQQDIGRNQKSLSSCAREIFGMLCCSNLHEWSTFILFFIRAP